MQNGGWLRASRSEHHLPTVDLQNARISSLLEEMRPKKLDDVLRVNVEDSTLRCPPAPPKYDDLYNDVSSSNVNLARRAPPDYSQLSSLRPSVSTWIVTSSDPRPQQPSWARYPKPLAVGDSRGPLSPAGYFRELELKNLSLSNRRSENKNNEEPPPMSPRVFSAGMSRNTPRQASFIAAIARHPLRETSQWNGAYSPSSSVEPPVDAANVAGEPRENVAPNANTPVRRPRSPTPYKRRKHPPKERLGKDEEVLPAPQLKNTLQQEEAYEAKVNYSPVLRYRNETLRMRRPRPKSYVLATSASMQEDGEHPSFSQDETSRDMSSMGSLSSVEHTSRSLNAPHPPASHRLHRFIALFSHNKSTDGTPEAPKQRMKRSRTSLPSSRVPFPPTILQRDLIERQNWVKHQEIALGKSGKRRQWDDRWAILVERSLFLCLQPPSFSNEKVVELGAHTRIDIQSSIVDIAYDYLSSTPTKQRHVVRLVSQTRCEHLIELATESEMLSWITVLQSSSEGNFEPESPSSAAAPLPSTAEERISPPSSASAKPQLPNSYSIASLASSCSTAASERHGVVPTSRSTHNCTSTPAVASASTSSACCAAASNASNASATNQLIMHRYKAKTSQLQSPVSNKRMENATATSHCAAHAGTSRESTSGENGAEATTPKSTRKWKKSKAGKQGSSGSSSSSSQHGVAAASGAHAAPGAGHLSAVLGVRLAECAVAKPGQHVPLLVQVCVAVVETHGMDTVGIYRIPGNTAAVNALKESLSGPGFESINPEHVETLDTRWRDVNVVSSLLKMFLRKLPEPLLTDKLYPFFIDANRIASHPQRLHKLRNLLRKLPRHHYETLRFLIRHLSQITKHSDVNKMESRNLALMFGPSIVRPSDDNMATMVTHMSDQCKIIETLIHYHDWMFNEVSTTEDAVPEQHPSETGTNASEPGSYGVGVPTGVSAASFNDMHNLIRKANEDQAAAMMNEGKAGKIKNILRRNSRRDKSRSKLKIESTAPGAMSQPRPAFSQPTPSSVSGNSVESAFCGNYQERDIDAEIELRQTLSSPPGASGSADVELSTGLDHSPSLESSLGSLPDTGGRAEVDDEARKKRLQDMYSARRIFIAGSAAAATDNNDTTAIDALANHSQHLNIASSPAFDVLSEETREKIRLMQKKQHWHHDTTKETRTLDLLKTYSPTKDITDALSFTSDYSTTSSAPLSSANPPLAVACLDQPNSSSDYASSDPSPCARNASSSPALRNRPGALDVITPEVNSSTMPFSKSQKIRLRVKAGNRDPARRHTLSDVDTLKEGRLDKLARWFGLRKSSPDVNAEEQDAARKRRSVTVDMTTNPPVIVRTSPTELTPVSGDEQL